MNFPHWDPMPRKNNNISRSRKSGAQPKAAAKTSSPPPAVELKPVPAPGAVLDQQKLQQLYSSMLKCQMLRQRLQQISPAPRLVAGREAVLAGALAHSRAGDNVMTAENRALVDMLRGESLGSVLSELASDAPSGEPSQPASSSHRQLALMRGTEKAKDLVGSGNAVLVFCGDNPEEHASRREALALAAKGKAPVVCFVEVRLAALADRAQPGPPPRAVVARGGVERRGRRGKSSPPPFPVIAVDGADVVAIFRVAQEAIRRARTGHGPSLIECVMPDDAGHDPLEFMEGYLRRKKLWSDEWRAEIARDFTAQLDSVPFR
jgi:TPP-dependent pyruvate/acetoin dehydrogenase alpha subunit